MLRFPRGSQTFRGLTGEADLVWVRKWVNTNVIIEVFNVVLPGH
jgi:hypothetical protein